MQAIPSLAPTVLLLAPQAGWPAAGAPAKQPNIVFFLADDLPLLKGGTLAERALFWHYPHYGNQDGAPSAAVRRGDWKLVEWQEDNRAELFNLAQDIGEPTDLGAKEPQRVAQLRAELLTWQKQVGAQLPIKGVSSYE